MPTRRQLVAALALLQAQIVLALPAAGQPLLPRLPFNDPKGTLFMLQPIMHVDHDPQDDPLDLLCVNYKGVGFPWCYDDHHGTDFMLRSAFSTMDSFDVEVVAAESVVVARNSRNAVTVFSTVTGGADHQHG